MKATCPKSKSHKRFITTAHVMEEWTVDENGKWIKSNETLQVDHGPDANNLWSCANCGADATVKP